MFARFTFRKINFAASKFDPWFSKALIRKSKIKSPLAITIAMLTASLVIIAFAVQASGWFAKPSLTKTAGGENQTQNTPTAVRIETELVTIRRHGFEPQEITRPADPFILAVENRSGLEEVTLRLDRAAGNRLKEVNIPRGKLNWRDAFDLPPGSYVLTEANHPDWVCSITITAK
jgi:hypothetical protein